MNPLKRLAAVIVAVGALAAPTVARVEHSTPDLIRAAQSHGITFKFNPKECDSGRYHGSYSFSTRIIQLCYNIADANAHDTVRHEVWHAIQHCAATKRGRPFEPIASRADLDPFVRSQLTDSQIVAIKNNYPKDAWFTEMEAFAAAEAYTADQLSQLLRGWCG